MYSLQPSSDFNSRNERIIYTQDMTFSSTNLLNRYGNNKSNSQNLFIKKIKKNYTFLKIRKLIEDFKNIKVLIIGETIIDQYVFCEALGMSGKEPMLVLRNIKSEDYLGGAAAISRHLSSFCKDVSLLSMIGEKEEHLKEIKRNKAISHLPLIKQSRLSVMPIDFKSWKIICKMGRI